MKILCFGDSVTFGEIDTDNGGWVDQLKQHYIALQSNSTRQDISVYNLGIGGETTDGLCIRFEIEFQARIKKGLKTLVMFAYGANDIVMHKNKNIVPLGYFIRNLKQCIQKAKQNASEVILLSLTPINDSIDGIINQHDKLRYSKDIIIYNSALKVLAEETNSIYLDTYGQFISNDKDGLLSSDGLHPNSAGHQVIQKMVKQKLEHVINKCNCPGLE
jgi:lysophospholipase L1-like esterase